MKITLDWLKDHLETSANAKEIAEKLNEIGFEVEEIEDQVENLRDITVAWIEKAQRHPDSDHLNICQVHDGIKEQPLQIICGAGNVHSDMKVALVHVGGVVPKSGQALKAAKICGTESQGMLCSYDELNLNVKCEEHSIIELPRGTEIGQPLSQALHFDDVIFTISITPNRGDCFSVRGLARELAAAGMGTLKPLNFHRFNHEKHDVTSFVNVETDKCHGFYGAVIENIHNQESPKWLQDRLIKVGQHPINALVDITNFINFDIGQPLHVYDLDKITGPVTVRQAVPGEKIQALNDHEYTLTSDMIVVADSQGLLSIAGIMGGEKSSSQLSTKKVFLEAAVFDDVAVAKAGQTLNLTSESRMRFERGIDAKATSVAFEYGLALIQDICSGSVKEVTYLPPTVEQQKVSLTLKELQDLSGDNTLTLEYGSEVLSALGFDILESSSTILIVSVPSWRHDVEDAADLAEEIIRIRGYCHLPCQALNLALPQKQTAISVLSAQFLKKALCARHFYEVYTFPFVHKQEFALFDSLQTAVEVLCPLNEEMPYLRPSLIPSLLKVVKSNQSQNTKFGSIFEIESVFKKGQQDVPFETKMLCGMRFGTTPKHWHNVLHTFDVFDAKADVEVLFQQCHMSSFQVDPKGAPNYYHPGRSGTLQQGRKCLGWFGEIHPSILKYYDIEEPVVAFEIVLDDALLAKCGDSKIQPMMMSTLQPLTRDFAFVFDKSVLASDIVKTIQKSDKLIQSVQIFDVFEGKGIEPHQKSIAVQILIQPMVRTLNEQDLQDLSQRVIDQVHQKLGGVLRKS